MLADEILQLKRECSELRQRVHDIEIQMQMYYIFFLSICVATVKFLNVYTAFSGIFYNSIFS